MYNRRDVKLARAEKPSLTRIEKVDYMEHMAFKRRRGFD